MTFQAFKYKLGRRENEMIQRETFSAFENTFGENQTDQRMGMKLYLN